MAWHKLGTAAWRQWVFSSGPARDPRGRSRPTQRYVVLDDDGSSSVAEGGNTAIARAILTTAVHAGQVVKAKLEPFSLTVAEHGVAATPDVLFEAADGRLFVPETKSSKYLTEAKLERLRHVEEVINKAGMTYLFWTDAWPLTPAVWRLLRETRRCGTSAVDEQELRRLADTIQDGPRTVRELREAGLYREIVLAGVWRGQAHINLFADLKDETVVSTDSAARDFESILSAPVDAHSWWRGLQRV
jgi:hypothetical protein